MKLEEQEAMDLLEDIAESECICPGDRRNAAVRAVEGVSMVDNTDTATIKDLTTKVDTLSQQFEVFAMKNTGRCSHAANDYAGTSMEDHEDVNYVGGRGYYQNNQPQQRQNFQRDNKYVAPHQRNNPYLSYASNNYLEPPPGFAEAHGCKPDIPVQNQRNQGQQQQQQQTSGGNDLQAILRQMQ